MPARRHTRPVLTPAQWRDVSGVLLIGWGLLCLVALVVHGAPLLDGLRGVVLTAFGYGWPLVLGSAIATGVFMVWPEPKTLAPRARPQRDDDEELEDGSAPAPRARSPRDDEDRATGHRPARPPAPSWLDVAVGLVAQLAALGLLSLLYAPAGGAVGRLGLWLVSPAGSFGGLLILVVVLILAAIVVLRLSPGRAARAALAGGQAVIAKRSSAAGLLLQVAGAPARIAGLRGLLEQPEAVPAETAAPAARPPSPPAVRTEAPAQVGERPTATGAIARPAVPAAEPQATGASSDSTGIALAGGGEVVDPEAATLLELNVDELGDDVDGQDDRHRTDWKLPDLSLLAAVDAVPGQAPAEIKRIAKLVEDTLAEFGVEAKVTSFNAGPSVTRYALQPAAGVQVRRIVSLEKDLALALGGVALRIEAPIPGQAAIGIEVPNMAPSLVTIREVVESAAFRRGRVLAVVLGKDVAGRPVVGDLTRMPHLLIAGATGQGKSVCINTLICSLLLQLGPDQLLLVMIDPKRVELQGYNGLPHLAVPVIVDPHPAASALRWAVAEMERRYRLLEAAGVRNIAAYNPRMNPQAEDPDDRPLPYVVIVIDELADLMMVAAGEVEELVCRIAQLARAVGIHLVIATQRPSVNIITGLIKANVPSRIAFAVGSQVDSRVVLDSVGAEKLLGRGDMLYKPVDAAQPTRLQGAFISDGEVEDLVGFWKAQGEPRHLEGVLDAAPIGPVADRGADDRELDSMFARAARAVTAEGAASVSLVQRKLNVGYSRAGRIVDQLAEHRVVGSYQGSKAREVLMNLPDVDELLERLGVEG